MSPPSPTLRLRLTLLGTFDAWSLSSERVLPRGKKARALLALTAMADGAALTRASLASLLWPRSAEEQARGSLRQAIHELTLCLAPAGPSLLLAGRDEVSLDASSTWVDALEVSRATVDSPGALELLVAPLLPEMEGISPALDEWLASRREGLRTGALALARQLLLLAPVAKREIARKRVLRLDPSDETSTNFSISREREGNILTLAAQRAGEQRFRHDGSGQSGIQNAGVTAQRPGAHLTRGSRLGVPPLSVLGSSVDNHLATGLAEEITTGLARFRWLFLADPATLATSSDPMWTATEMGLDGIILGSVQRVGQRVRVILRLVDLRSSGETSNSVLWTARFDSEEPDLLTLQDEVATAVVARLDPELLLIEARRASARPPANTTAHDLVLRAIPALHAIEKTSFDQAGRLLNEALSSDPEYAAAHAWAACWHIFQIGQGWSSDHDRTLTRADELAVRATRLDPSDALATTIQGHVLAYLHHRPEEGCVLHDRALALNPNLSMAWVFSSLAHCYCGRHEEALRRFARYSRLAPLHPLAFFFDAAKLVPLMLLGKYLETIEAAQAVSVLNANFSFPLRPWLACLGWLGRNADASVVRARLMALEPDLTIKLALRRAPLRPLDRDIYAEGLRRAGLAEE